MLEGRRAAAVELVMSLPWQHQPSTVQRKRLIDLVDTAWTAGWTSEALRAELVAELNGVRSLYAVWASRLRDLPPPRVGETRSAPALPPRCDDPRHDPYAHHRLLIDPDTDRPGRKCPNCHPDFISAKGGPR
ncbi:hypothetical protein ACIBCT_39120 [Streptosporangium sp. NPDC050855]|uniref:hypothetical protein n=1 Tax=Streptosporangium sp. NPDC050855 TaxID=3366194 RepID=UPI00379AA5C1